MILFRKKEIEKVPVIDATATESDDGSVTVFCVNRDLKDDFCLGLALRSFGDLRLAEHIMLHHDDVKAVNTEENPGEVVRRPDRAAALTTAGRKSRFLR